MGTSAITKSQVRQMAQLMDALSDAGWVDVNFEFTHNPVTARGIINVIKRQHRATIEIVVTPHFGGDGAFQGFVIQRYQSNHEHYTADTLPRWAKKTNLPFGTFILRVVVVPRSIAA